MPRQLVFFDEGRIALHREVKKHPKLVELLQSYGADDFPGILGEVAAYCGVVVDGDYIEPEIDKLCTILLFKLKEKQRIIVL